MINNLLLFRWKQISQQRYRLIKIASANPHKAIDQLIEKFGEDALEAEVIPTTPQVKIICRNEPDISVAWLWEHKKDVHTSYGELEIANDAVIAVFFHDNEMLELLICEGKKKDAFNTFKKYNKGAYLKEVEFLRKKINLILQNSKNTKEKA